jgi:hypothetical protein
LAASIVDTFWLSGYTGAREGFRNKRFLGD